MTTLIQLLSPPGDTIQEHIDFIGMSQAELAERMGRPKEKINDVIKGREPISEATAFQLETVLGIPASFWLNREKTYRKELYELQQVGGMSYLHWSVSLLAYTISTRVKYYWV